MKRITISKILPLTVAIIAVGTILICAVQSKCYKNEIINFGLFMATTALALTAYIQLKALREQANADFLLKFNREFFVNEINQQIIIAIEEKKELLIINKGKFTDYQLDDYLV